MIDCGRCDIEPSSSCRLLLVVSRDVLRVLRRQVVDEHRLAVFHAPDRQLVVVRRRPGVRRVALALLDRQAVLDLLFLRVIQPDAEDVGVGELVDPFVELAEDRVEVERRGDLTADLAEQLDVLLAFALRPRQRLGGFGAQLRFRKPRSLALLAHQAIPLQPVDDVHAQHQQHDVAAVGEPGAVPGRQDRERVGGFLADRARDAARAHAEPVVAEAQVREVAAGLARPRRPVVSRPSSLV